MKAFITVLVCLAGSSFSRMIQDYPVLLGVLNDPSRPRLQGTIKTPGPHERFPECAKSTYGCCPDESFSEDAKGVGCARTLCYDLDPNYCASEKRKGSLDRCETGGRHEHCYFSCGEKKCRRKYVFPPQSCEQKYPGRKCCWDGLVSMNGWCPSCFDIAGRITCQRFKKMNGGTCITGSIYKRMSFNMCANTCGVCSE